MSNTDLQTEIDENFEFFKNKLPELLKDQRGKIRYYFETRRWYKDYCDKNRSFSDWESTGSWCIRAART